MHTYKIPTTFPIQSISKEDKASSILRRICVQPPYFNLKNLYLEGRCLSASATAEMHIPFEVGPMTATELGRHAAINGSSLLALLQKDDQKRYYLANHAEYHSERQDALFGTPIKFQSRIIDSSKRQAKVSNKATVNGRSFAELIVSYSILTESAFQRLFSAYQQAALSTANPYTKLIQESFKKTNHLAEQRFVVPASACVGHFKNYPALPIAILVGQLSYLAGQILGKPYWFKQCSVDAK